MKKLTRIFCLIAILVVITSCSNNKIKCVLKGEVYNIKYDTLALMKATEDLEWGEKVLIPVTDGRFEYVLTIGLQEVYLLFFVKQLEVGPITTYEFVPVNGTVHFKLYPSQEYDKVEIIGGEANKEPFLFNDLYNEKFGASFETFLEKLNELHQQQLYYIEEIYDYQEMINNARVEQNHEQILFLTTKRQELFTSGEHLSPYGIKIKHEHDSLNAIAIDWSLDFYSESLSVFSYYQLINTIRSLEFQKGLDVGKIESITQKFHEKYPEHPYTELTKAQLKAREKVQIGKKYIDFTLPDLEGNMHKLSDIIDGKFAVIDLWASWCGPCIIGSRELLPIYDEFKGMGFTICGVAREFRNTNAMASRIEQEKYPWINLVELDDQNDIWLTYGAQGGGRKFFVDDKGIILAIEPTAAEIREILNARPALH